MPAPQGVWGIDIGQCAMKAVRLELVDGHPTATAFDYVEHPKILSQPDADPDVLIREALTKFLDRNQIRHDQVAIGIAGQSGLARFVKLPPVEEKKIPEIVKFEAKQQIPFPLDEVVWDFQKIAGGSVTDGFAMETEVGLFAMKRDIISRYLGYFAGSKIDVNIVQMSPLALVNYATFEVLKKGGVPIPEEEQEEPEEIPRGKQRCVVVLDIGTDGSNLIITDGEKIIWQRPVPLGGNSFTRALTKDLKLTFAKAEHLKRNAAKSPELPQILKALKPVLQDFVGEVQRSLGYFTNTHRNAHVAHLVGLGSAFKLPGLQKYLAEKLQIDVKKPTSLDRLRGDGVKHDPVFQENLLTFPVAYGLALQGLGLARLTTNLLPNEIRVERLVKAKKPFAAAAAAALLLGTGALALGYSMPYKAVVGNKVITDARGKAKSAVALVGSQETAFKAKTAELDALQNSLKAINAGQDERLNWPRFEETLSEALPHPGPKGNVDRDLWEGDNRAGVAALKWFNERMATGVPIERAEDDDLADHPAALAIVNVEGVHTRWAEKVGNFLNAADLKVKERFSRDIADDLKEDEKEKDTAVTTGERWKPKPPPPDPVRMAAAPDGGWVVEIRGYTFHDKRDQFVRRALLKNLQKMDSFVTDDKKVGQILPGVQDPVKGRVSHVFVYNIWPEKDRSTTLKYAHRTYLEELFGAGTGGPGGPGPGFGRPVQGEGPGPGPGPGGGTTPPEPLAQGGWKPLGTVEGTAAGPGGGIAPPGPPGLRGGEGGPTPAGTPTDPKRKGVRELQRSEFVIMLIWREPIPSGGGAKSEGGGPTP